jgi:hypothetical protein
VRINLDAEGVAESFSYGGKTRFFNETDEKIPEFTKVCGEVAEALGQPLDKALIRAIEQPVIEVCTSPAFSSS